MDERKSTRQLSHDKIQNTLKLNKNNSYFLTHKLKLIREINVNTKTNTKRTRTVYHFRK